jgi:hypothetical protein
MNRWTGLILLATALLVGLPATLGLADSGASASAHLTWRVVPFQSLTIAGHDQDGASVADHVTLPEPSAADLARGYVQETAALVLSATSNIPWTVKVQAVESNMGTSTDGSYRKPLSDFHLRANGGAYVTLSPFAQTLAAGTPGAQHLSIDYRVSVDPQTYRPGAYGVTLLYTITGT